MFQPLSNYNYKKSKLMSLKQLNAEIQLDIDDPILKPKQGYYHLLIFAKHLKKNPF